MQAARDLQQVGSCRVQGLGIPTQFFQHKLFAFDTFLSSFYWKPSLAHAQEILKATLLEISKNWVHIEFRV